MKILFLCNEYPLDGIEPGGIGRYLQVLSRWLADNGHDIFIAGWHNHIGNTILEKNDNGIRVWNIPEVEIDFCRGFKKLSVSASLLLSRYRLRNVVSDIIRKNNIQLLEGSDFAESLFLIKASIPIICRIHNPRMLIERSKNKILTPGQRLQDWACRKADYFVAVSHWAQTLAQDHWDPAINKPVATISNPVANCFYDVKRKKHDINKNRIIFSGSITTRKGIHELLYSWEKLKILNKNVSLHVYGKPADCMEPLQNSINNSNGRLVFHGPVTQNELAAAYQQAGLAVFPSRYESDGIAAKEAAAAGVPVIVSDIGPFHENFNGISSVLMFAVNDKENLLETIIESLAGIEVLTSQAEDNRKYMDKFHINHLGPVNEKYFSNIIEQQN